MKRNKICICYLVAKVDVNHIKTAAEKSELSTCLLYYTPIPFAEKETYVLSLQSLDTIEHWQVHYTPGVKKMRTFCQKLVYASHECRECSLAKLMC